jgi:hypothetical protein
MFTELSVVEQRYLAVRVALNGARVTGPTWRLADSRRTPPGSAGRGPW